MFISYLQIYKNHVATSCNMNICNAILTVAPKGIIYFFHTMQREIKVKNQKDYFKSQERSLAVVLKLPDLMLLSSGVLAR